jgi:hypothetical protein
MKIMVYNVDPIPVKAHVTGWEIDPRKWEITQATEANPESALDNVSTRTEDFERSKTLDFTFAPHSTTVLEFKLVSKGVPYWSRPDVGIDPEDVKVDGHRVTVTVHSLGSVGAPASKVVLRDGSGKIVATAVVPPIKAPLDLQPKTAVASMVLPPNLDWKGGSVTVETDDSVPEITQLNNTVQFAEVKPKKELPTTK